MSYYITSMYTYFKGWVPGAARNYEGSIQYLKDNAPTMIGITQDMVTEQLNKLKSVDWEEEKGRRQEWVAPETFIDYVSGHPRYTRYSGIKRKATLYIIMANELKAPRGVKEMDGDSEDSKKMRFLRWFARVVKRRRGVLKQLQASGSDPTMLHSSVGWFTCGAYQPDSSEEWVERWQHTENIPELYDDPFKWFRSAHHTAMLQEIKNFHPSNLHPTNNLAVTIHPIC